MVNDRVGVVLDRLRVVFDDERAVANAGLLLPATVASRLEIERLVDERVDLGERAGAARPGRKVLTLCHAMLLGADSIDDCEVLRRGRTGLVSGDRVLAPSMLGTFLRSFTFGQVRQLDRVLAETLRRAWQAGAGPGEQRLVIDLDSFVGEVHGYAKEGAASGYTRQLGYQPLLATRAGSDEVLQVRLRKGSAHTQRGALRFVDELIAGVRRAGRGRRDPRPRRHGLREQEAHRQATGEGLSLLDRDPRPQAGCRGDRGDPRRAVAAGRRLPGDGHGRDRRDRARRRAAGRSQGLHPR